MCSCFENAMGKNVTYSLVFFQKLNIIVRVLFVRLSYGVNASTGGTRF